MILVFSAKGKQVARIVGVQNHELNLTSRKLFIRFDSRQDFFNCFNQDMIKSDCPELAVGYIPFNVNEASDTVFEAMDEADSFSIEDIGGFATAEDILFRRGHAPQFNTGNRFSMNNPTDPNFHSHVFRREDQSEAPEKASVPEDPSIQLNPDMFGTLDDSPLKPSASTPSSRKRTGK